MQENTQTFYHILPNGIKIVHRRTPSPVAYIGVTVGAGTRDEAPEENGMAHYIEHCVFKGTAHHSARQIIHAIEGIGGEINAYTTKEETTFYAAILCEHVQLTLHLIAEMLLEPAFKKEETDKIKQIGGVSGKKLTTKKSIEKKAEILKHSVDFGGTLNDVDCMKLTGLSRNTFYKYKRELKAEAESEAE